MYSLIDKYVSNYKKKLAFKKVALEEVLCDMRPSTCVLQGDFKIMLLTDLSKVYNYLTRNMLIVLIHA